MLLIIRYPQQSRNLNSLIFINVSKLYMGYTYKLPRLGHEKNLPVIRKVRSFYILTKGVDFKPSKNSSNCLRSICWALSDNATAGSG